MKGVLFVVTAMLHVRGLWADVRVGSPEVQAATAKLLDQSIRDAQSARSEVVIPGTQGPVAAHLAGQESVAAGESPEVQAATAQLLNASMQDAQRPTMETVAGQAPTTQVSVPSVAGQAPTTQASSVAGQAPITPAAFFAGQAPTTQANSVPSHTNSSTQQVHPGLVAPPPVTAFPVLTSLKNGAGQFLRDVASDVVSDIHADVQNTREDLRNAIRHELTGGGPHQYYWDGHYVHPATPYVTHQLPIQTHAESVSVLPPVPSSFQTPQPAQQVQPVPLPRPILSSQQTQQPVLSSQPIVQVQQPVLPFQPIVHVQQSVPHSQPLQPLTQVQVPQFQPLQPVTQMQQPVVSSQPTPQAQPLMATASTLQFHQPAPLAQPQPQPLTQSPQPAHWQHANGHGVATSLHWSDHPKRQSSVYTSAHMTARMKRRMRRGRKMRMGDGMGDDTDRFGKYMQPKRRHVHCFCEATEADLQRRVDNFLRSKRHLGDLNTRNTHSHDQAHVTHVYGAQHMHPSHAISNQELLWNNPAAPFERHPGSLAEYGYMI